MWEHKGLCLILALYLILALWYSVTIPLGEAPDEAPHYSLVRYVARERGYPTGGEEHEAFQPPLYYLVGALATFWIDTDDFVIKANSDFSFTDPQAPQNLLLHTAAESFPYRGWALAWHLVRLLSVSMGAVTITATYALARHLFPQQPYFALGTAALNALIPAFLFTSSVANNDNLATMLSALALLVIVKSVKGGNGPSHFATLGFLAGLGALTKFSLLALLPLALIAAALLAHREVGPLAAKVRGGLGRGLAFLSPFFMVSGPWFWRNWNLYGDPLAWAQVLRLNALREAPLSAQDWLGLFEGLYSSFWLSWIGIDLDVVVHVVLALAVLASWAGLLHFALREKEPLTCALLSLLGIYAFLIFLALLRWTTVVLGTGQARLLYPALPALLIFLFLGWRELIPQRYASALAYGVGGGMLLLAALTPVKYIAPLYAPPPLFTPADLEGIEHRQALDFGGLIRLHGYEIEAKEVSPGETLLLSLYWEALKDIERDYWLLLQVVDERDEPVLVKDGSPSAGRYATDLWKGGELIPSQHRLYIPEEAPPGHYRIKLGLHPFGLWEWLPIFDEEGKALGEVITLAGIEIR